MKLFKFLAGVAVCTATTFFLASCQKDEHGIDTIVQHQDQSRGSGAVEDDPSLLAKLPMIVSDDFLKQSRDFSETISYARGKPIKGGNDVTAPSVTITSPSNAATVSGTVNVQASASDNVGVSFVTLSVDGTSIASDNSTPYSIPWNSASVSNGTHTLTVVARDAAGNTNSSSIQVNVNTVLGTDITSPSIAITSPGNGAAVSGTVSVQASASDNIGVSNVQFSVDGNVVGSDNTAPFSFSWNSGSVASGLHTLTALATDAAGNAGSASIQVTVNTVVVSPPTLPAAYQLAMPPVSNQGSEGSCVSFAVGYAARSSEQYYRTGASSFSLSTNTFSPEFLYNQTKVSSSCSSGSSILGALEFLKNTGICSWQSMPYSSSNGCSLLPTSTQTAEAASFKINSYTGIYTADITSIKTMLASNHPLVIMFALDQSFYSAGPGFIWSSYSGSNGVLHAVTICGYDDARHAVKIMNSWGTGWGDSGYSWIDYDFLPSLTNQVVAMNL